MINEPPCEHEHGTVWHRFRIYLHPFNEDTRDTLNFAMDLADEINFHTWFDRLIYPRDN